ncbi:hypothetical protein SBD_6332 [Streptomyces bottropensis ATCC 25435]|uniref:Uncharacterized protein n=1 Tax=Streptomyces bottropensis ATCC 25435 TaxID=1054862 RepID=M3FIF8_9ACTN|nr:hypothetical protein SBD_6332 [Streptomyces bottropensis ATCC 25435]
MGPYITEQQPPGGRLSLDRGLRGAHEAPRQVGRGVGTGARSFTLRRGRGPADRTPGRERCRTDRSPPPDEYEHTGGAEHDDAPRPRWRAPVRRDARTPPEAVPAGHSVG